MSNNFAAEQGIYCCTVRISEMQQDNAESLFHYGRIIGVNLVDEEGNAVPAKSAGALNLYGIRKMPAGSILKDVVLLARPAKGLYDVITDESTIMDLLEACGLKDVKELVQPPVVMAKASTISREEAAANAAKGRAERMAARKLAMKAGAGAGTEAPAPVAQPNVV
jgi:hypothetical protein